MSENIRKVTIQGVVLGIADTYVGGEEITLSDGEANALNQTRAENIRNNFASIVVKAKEAAEKDGVAVDEAALQKELDSYAEGYEFGVRQSRAGGTTKDPVLSEARKMASKMVKEMAARQGKKWADISDEKKDAAIAAVLERNPALMEQARVRVEAARAAADTDISISL